MVDHPAPRPRVLLVSHDVISPNMAGPGIRSLELAWVLSEEFDVTLATPNDCELSYPHITIHPYRYGNWEMLRGAVEGVRTIIATAFSLNEFPELGKLGIPLVIDIYDPFPLENLYIYEDAEPEKKRMVQQTDMGIVDAMCSYGDLFLCATPRQRDWWLGVLQAKGRVNPATVGEDPSLRRLLDEMPFGLPSRPFEPQAPGPKALLPGLSPDDRLILWGGGLWNWLDPLRLIEAMPAVLAQEPRAKLLFPGTRHPNSAVPEMKRTDEAIELARALGLLDRAIFFGDWVPYEQWPAYLTDADVAVSLHFDTIETQFSAMRSRVLSYIWARLPMVVSGGDSASRTVEQYGLGEVVPYGGSEPLSEALLRVLAHGKPHYASRFDALAATLTWHEVARPLLAFCREPRIAPDKAPEWQAIIQTQGKVRQLWEKDVQLGQKAQQIAWLEGLLEQERATVAAYEQGRFMSLMRAVGRARGWLQERLAR